MNFHRYIIIAELWRP